MREYKSREFKKILIDNGYEYIRTKGDHATYRNNEISKSITINIVRLKPVVANRLIKEYGLLVK